MAAIGADVLVLPVGADVLGAARRLGRRRRVVHRDQLPALHGSTPAAPLLHAGALRCAATDDVQAKARSEIHDLIVAIGLLQKAPVLHGPVPKVPLLHERSLGRGTIGYIQGSTAVDTDDAERSALAALHQVPLLIGSGPVGPLLHLGAIGGADAHDIQGLAAGGRPRFGKSEKMRIKLRCQCLRIPRRRPGWKPLRKR